MVLRGWVSLSMSPVENGEVHLDDTCVCVCRCPYSLCVTYTCTCTSIRRVPQYTCVWGPLHMCVECEYGRVSRRPCVRVCVFVHLCMRTETWVAKDMCTRVLRFRIRPTCLLQSKYGRPMTGVRDSSGLGSPSLRMG